MEIRHLNEPHTAGARPAALVEPLLFGYRMKNHIMVRMNHLKAAPLWPLRQ